MKIFKRFSFLINIIIVLNSFIIISEANNLTISNVSLADRNPSDKTLIAQFDIRWDHAWKTKINHDAVWLTFRLHSPSVTPTDKKLCQITDSGLNPIHSSTGTATNIEIYVPEDQKGAFVRLNHYAVEPTVDSESVQVELDYDACGFTANDSVFLTVSALEMVYIPQGEFYAGDYMASTAALHAGSSDDNPWYIADEESISISNPTSNGYRYASAGLPGEDVTGTTFNIPGQFPKGYNGFYMMKYEITEGQWVEFINSLPSSGARANHDLTDNNHKNTDTVVARNTISCSGTPLSCSTQRPQRALGYLSWMDLAAFLDWSALRPMTELEFEKSARGPVLPKEGEFAWGATGIVSPGALTAGDENGSEESLTAEANANVGNVTLTGGDTPYGPDFVTGPLRSGIFASEATDRESSGASYYGVMELSGNLRERIVTVGNAAGRSFAGSHGDGVLSTASGYEGNADQSDWPGIDAQINYGVTGAAGSGFRGGSFTDVLPGSPLTISNREEAAKADINAYNNSGGRGVRTYDGN
ncbi:MAG: SUMF1/EgtB/PvdO family nonheme iron enzyme [Candidatus Omnitrophica bacterium]|nr:SUMF1/EgtB/PvdO family nonheme iron enzyme [Candidatus Omnitrophota bacterium]